MQQQQQQQQAWRATYTTPLLQISSSFLTSHPSLSSSLSSLHSLFRFMAGLIDLNNATEDDETPSSGSSSSSTVCLELWHACAGPMISLPKKGSVVVYFPQGHLEQHLHDFPLPASANIPSHVFCRVLDVKLHVGGVLFSPYNSKMLSLLLLFFFLLLCAWFLTLNVCYFCAGWGREWWSLLPGGAGSRKWGEAFFFAVSLWRKC